MDQPFLLDDVVAVAVAVAGKKTVGAVAETPLLPPSFSSPLLFGVWSAGRDASSDALGPPARSPAHCGLASGLIQGVESAG